MSNALEIILKDVVTALLMYYTDICLEGLGKPRKTSFRVAGVQGENGIEHLWNISLEHYHITILHGNTYRLIYLSADPLSFVISTAHKLSFCNEGQVLTTYLYQFKITEDLKQNLLK